MGGWRSVSESLKADTDNASGGRSLLMPRLPLMKRALILLSVFGLLLGACGGGEAAPKNGDLKAKLLETSDLPDGFKRTNAEEREPGADDSSESNSDFCPQLDKLDEDYPGEREAEATFERTSATGGVYLNEQIARFKDSDEADDAFAAFEKGFANCKTFSQEGEDGKMAGTFEKTDFAKAGDDTYAAIFKATQSTAEGQNVNLEGHFVAMHDGENVVLLVALGFGDQISKSDLEAVAKKAVAKL